MKEKKNMMTRVDKFIYEWIEEMCEINGLSKSTLIRCILWNTMIDVKSGQKSEIIPTGGHRGGEKGDWWNTFHENDPKSRDLNGIEW